MYKEGVLCNSSSSFLRTSFSLKYTHMSSLRVTKNKIQNAKADRKLSARKRGLLILFIDSRPLISCSFYVSDSTLICVTVGFEGCASYTIADRRSGRCNTVPIQQ